MKNKHYILPFCSLNGNHYELAIYTDDYAGEIVTLTGDASPFETDEDSTDDLYEPLRGQTGNIHIVARGTDLMEGLIPTDATSHYVSLTNTDTGELLWQGFLGDEAYSQDWDDGVHVIDLPVNSILATMEAIQLPKGYIGGDAAIYRMLEICFEVVKGYMPEDRQFQLFLEQHGTFMNVNLTEMAWYELDVHTYNWFEDTEVSSEMGKYTILEGDTLANVVRGVLTLFGMVMRERGSEIYITSPDVVGTTLEGGESPVTRGDGGNLALANALDIQSAIDYTRGARSIKLTTTIAPVDNISNFPEVENSKQLREWDDRNGDKHYEAFYPEVRPTLGEVEFTDCKTEAHFTVTPNGVFSNVPYLDIDTYNVGYTDVSHYSFANDNAWGANQGILRTDQQMYERRWQLGAFFSRHAVSKDNKPAEPRSNIHMVMAAVDTDKTMHGSHEWCLPAFSFQSNRLTQFDGGYLNLQFQSELYAGFRTPVPVDPEPPHYVVTNPTIFEEKRYRAIMISIWLDNKYWDNKEKKWSELGGLPTPGYGWQFYQMKGGNLVGDRGEIVTDIKDGLFIPLEPNMSGRVKVWVMPLLQVSYEEANYYNLFEMYINDISMRYIPPRDVTSVDDDSYDYIRYTGINSQEEKSVSSDIGTCIEGLQQNGAGTIMKPFGEGALQYLTYGNYTQRPEQSLLDRMEEYYKTSRMALTENTLFSSAAYKRQPLDLFHFNGRQFTPQSTSIEWSEDEMTTRYAEFRKT